MGATETDEVQAQDYLVSWSNPSQDPGKRVGLGLPAEGGR
jgi:hypothetical protein